MTSMGEPGSRHGEGQAPPPREEGEVLFQELCRCFQEDPSIDEYAFVISANPSLWDGSDLHGERGAATVFKSRDRAELDLEHRYPFYLREGKLGIAFWALPKLYKFAYGRFKELNRELRRRCLLDEEPGQDLVPFRDEEGRELVVQVFLLTRAILLINPDCYTAWNARKKLILRGHAAQAPSESLASEAQEVRLIDLIFTKHPKSGESWAHRRWALTRLLSSLAAPSSSSNSDSQRQTLLDREMKVVELVAHAYPKNYYAWTHRRWIASRLSIPELEQEMSRMNLWSRRHISDHAGLHHRQVLLMRLIHLFSDSSPTAEQSQPQPQRLRDLWLQELAFVRELITNYPGHEALWSHRRFLIHYWLHLSLTLTSTPASASATTLGTERSIAVLELACPVLRDELRFAEDCILDDEVTNFAAQRTFAARYQLWITQLCQSLAASLSIDLDSTSPSPASTLLGSVIPKDRKRLVELCKLIPSSTLIAQPIPLPILPPPII